MRPCFPQGGVPTNLMRWLLGGLLGTCLLFLAGCASMLNPQGPVALAESDLFWLILIVATIVFVLVEGALLYSVVRFRARPDAPEPRQMHGNTRLEIWWTIVPSLLLFLVLALTVRTLLTIQEPGSTPARPTLSVNVFGHQWWWEFRYFANQDAALANAENVARGVSFNAPQPSVVTANELVVPVGTVVHLNLISDNVIHSFWIPQLTGKTDVIPSHVNQMWFQADAPGTCLGACAEFCGDQHANMRFAVVAKPMNGAESFEAWMAAQQQPACDPQRTTPQPAQCRNANPNPDLVAEGKKVFFSGVFLNNTACIQCHSVYGTRYQGIEAKGIIGPNLTHFGSRDMIAGGVLADTPDHLAQWLTDPQHIKPGNDMPNLHLTPAQVQALVAYLESLR